MRRRETYTGVPLKLLLGLLLAVPACGPYEPNGTPGALKQGGFVYCESPNEPCAAVPDAIAEGSTFQLRFEGEDYVDLSTPDDGTLEVLDQATDSERTTTFRALGAGKVRVEAHRRNRELVDFVTFEVDGVDHLDLRICTHSSNSIASPGARFPWLGCSEADAGALPAVVLSRGQPLAPTVCAFPTDSSGSTLSGALPFQWTPPTDGAELELFVSSDRHCAAVGGLTVGTGELRVSESDVTASIPVVVFP